MSKFIRIVAMCIPFVAVAGVALSRPENPPTSTTQDQCKDCVDGKKAPAGTNPDYDTTCYPATGLPPLLKRVSCKACLQAQCGNACGETWSPSKCGV